ncbi:MAG: hypothetical protein KBT67_09565 [bacterium]|nr:hypothetical protein [Candidatus Limimorpha caballi]
MKKVLLIMAAALMTMTQCRKQETVPATPSANTIKMTITAGPGAKTNIDDNGAITWSEGDVLYVSDGTNWLGSLTLQSGAGNASGTFTGNISEISDGTTCHFFYLGHDNDMTGTTGTTNAVISFASQDGSREGALKYHLGHGSADVTVREGEATGAVRMSTKIAIAHIKLKMDGADYKGKVTMDVSNTMTVSPAVDFSGSGNGITIAAGTSGDRYVTLIPTEATSVNFSGSATGSMTFGHGIQANNLYGMAAGIEVTLTAAHEYVDLGLPSGLLWATCNVGADSPEDYGDYFAWGETSTKSDYTWSTYKWCNGSYNTLTKYNTKSRYGTVDNKTTLEFSDDAARANWGGSWRMPTEAEFQELINNTNKTWTTVNGVGGWKCANKSDASDYIFLPAAGYRLETSLGSAGSIGDYWSSSLSTSNPSYGRRLYFNSNDFSMYDSNRYDGFTVRPVR